MKELLVKKIRKLALILGILTAIIMGTLPFVRMMVSLELAVMMLGTGVVLFVFSMLMIIISMVINPQLLVKLAAIPVMYAIIMIGYILHELNVFNIFKVMLGVQMENPEQVFQTTTSFGKLSWILHGGVWICSIPLVVVAILKVIKLNKQKNIDFSTYETTQGTITEVIDTHTMINKIKVYKISFNISYYNNETYSVTKEMKVPIHIIHSIAIGKVVTLKVNPKNKKDVYIQNEYGII